MSHPMCTIFMSDVVSFSSWSRDLPPSQVGGEWDGVRHVGRHRDKAALQVVPGEGCKAPFFGSARVDKRPSMFPTLRQVMRTLNDLYSRLDDVLVHELPSLYKVETIGDA